MATIDKWLKSAVEAIDAEIEAVLEKPSEEVLHNGVRQQDHHYRFEAGNPALRYAEQFRANLEPQQEVEVLPVEAGDQYIVLDFQQDLGEHITQVRLEWENDFILRKLREQLTGLQGQGSREERERVHALMEPDLQHTAQAEKNEPAVRDDGMRNQVQQQALRMALTQPVSFIWGPPGTGKTATLGFTMANFLLQDRRVLFVTNTNRAVDVGMISTLQALQELQETGQFDKVTRFGEAALDSAVLQQVQFEKQRERRQEQEKEKLQQLYTLLDEYRQWAGTEEAVLDDRQKMRRDLLARQIEQNGGVQSLEQQIEEAGGSDEAILFKELRQKKVIGTTLARVCTSEILLHQSFDAVVVDEASMANLPYLMVMAARATRHMVLVGDPMQLPPISLTTDRSARKMLETDIFTLASGASRPGDLFKWHDEHPHHTAFFDTQYRLNSDLAEVISDVFYEGRLKTDSRKQKPIGGGASVRLIDTRTERPVLVKQAGDRQGFRPMNEVHEQQLMEWVRTLVYREQVPMREIGIMVPFRATVWRLRHQLRSHGWHDVEVGTIHTFQGREKRAILFDTVMSGEQQNGRRRHYSVRPFDEQKNGMNVIRLLNVAFTRCREKLIVIADMDHVQQVYREKFLGRLLHRLQR